MLEFLSTADDVMALKVAQKITGSDLDRIMDRLDQALAEHETIHVFVESEALNGIEITGLGSYVARAWPLFGKLGRFGRVAVVADQSWVRFGTRLESALLPNINYRTFTPEHRDEALAWVTAARR